MAGSAEFDPGKALREYYAKDLAEERRRTPAPPALIPEGEQGAEGPGAADTPRTRRKSPGPAAVAAMLVVSIGIGGLVVSEGAKIGGGGPVILSLKAAESLARDMGVALGKAVADYAEASAPEAAGFFGYKRFE